MSTEGNVPESMLAGETLFGDPNAAAAIDEPTAAAAGSPGDLQLVFGLICEEIRIDNGAATAVRIADTFLVEKLPVTVTVAMMLRFRGRPGTHSYSILLDDGNPRKLLQDKLAISSVGTPSRTVLMPRTPLTLTHTGLQRLVVLGRSGVLGNLPIWVNPRK